jgi:hypothetical protein
MRVGEQAPSAEEQTADALPTVDRQELVDECVRRVLQMLKTRQER